MNVVVACALCLFIFGPTLVNGLLCYQCTICDDPFNENNANSSVVNATGSNEACYKITADGAATVRGASTSCIAAHIGNYGTWCCNTNLCNGAQSTASINLKLLMASLFLAIAMIKIIQPNRI